MSSAILIQLRAALTHWRSELFSKVDEDTEVEEAFSSGINGLELLVMGWAHWVVRDRPVEIYHTSSMDNVQNDTHCQVWRIHVHTVRRELD
jgi:hypothetical protein